MLFSKNIFFKWITLFLLTFTTILVKSQEEKATNYWVNFSSENDFLGLTVTSDRYYSFGERLDFLLKSKKSTDQTLHFFNFRLKLEGHTPDHLQDSLIPKYTRPYFGWVFSSMQWIFTDSKNYFKYGADIGVSGPIAKVGDYQNWYHKNITNGKEVNGWKNQTPNKLGINLRLDYKHWIYGNEHHAFRLGSEQILGNIYTSISPTVNYQYNSLATKSYLPFNYTKDNKSNLALEADFGFRYEFHNAALQGEYFSRNNTSLSTKIVDNSQIYRFQLVGSVSLRYTFSHFTVFASNIFNSKRVEKNYYHNYGIFGIGWNW